MNTKKVNEIMSKVMKEWAKRYDFDNIDPMKVKMTRDMLLLSPHEDGFMRVEVSGDGVYLVPFEDIILDGLRGEEISKRYEKEKSYKEKEFTDNVVSEEKMFKKFTDKAQEYNDEKEKHNTNL